MLIRLHVRPCLARSYDIELRTVVELELNKLRACVRDPIRLTFFSI